MSIKKIKLPFITILQQQYLENKTEFIKLYSSYDTYTGPIESIEYVLKLLCNDKIKRSSR